MLGPREEIVAHPRPRTDPWARQRKGVHFHLPSDERDLILKGLIEPDAPHRVHVNATMSTNQLSDSGDQTSGKSSPRDDENALRAPMVAPTCRKPSTVIFRRRVRVLDEQDREWLKYESLCSAGQRHTRFAAGWATL